MKVKISVFVLAATFVGFACGALAPLAANPSKCRQVYDVYSAGGSYNKTICVAPVSVRYITGYAGLKEACMKEGARPFRGDSSEALIAAQNLFVAINSKATSLYIEGTTNGPDLCSLVSYNPTSAAVSVKTGLCTYQSSMFCEFIKAVVPTTATTTSTTTTTTPTTTTTTTPTTTTTTETTTTAPITTTTTETTTTTPTTTTTTTPTTTTTTPTTTTTTPTTTTTTPTTTTKAPVKVNEPPTYLFNYVGSWGASNKRYYTSLISKNWNEAAAFCTRFNMGLATFDTAADASNLKSLILDVFHWVGVQDLQEGIFKNYNDGKIVNSILPWKQGEPNNAGGGENCLMIFSDGIYDSDCSRYFPMVCELKLPNEPVALVEDLVEVIPPNNLFFFMGFSVGTTKRYFASRVSKNWADGLSLCMRYDMDYVTFGSKSEADYFFTLLKNEYYWIGVNDIVYEGLFQNYNDKATVTSFINWNRGEPNNAGDEDCIQVAAVGTIDLGCNYHSNVVCERRIPKKLATTVQATTAPDPPASSFDYVGYSSTVNRKYFLSKQTRWWHDGITYCAENDMDFTYFETRAETEYYATLRLEAWVGFTDTGSEGSYHKYDGNRATVGGDVILWNSGEPNNAGPNENCAASTSIGRFDDRNCYSSLLVGCMR